MPATLRLASSATAAWVSEASVVPSAAALMLPPLRPMALAAMLMPFPSRSAACTSYLKCMSVMPPVPRLKDKSASLVALPIVSATWGPPEDLMKRSNTTFTSMVSPSR